MNDEVRSREELIVEVQRLRARLSKMEETAFQDTGTKRAVDADADRYEALFHDSPVPLWEEDFTELNQYIEGLKARGVRDFREYFKENPTELRECLGKVKVLNVNQAAIELHEANNKTVLLENLEKIFTEKSYEVFTEEIAAIADGQSYFMAEAEVRTIAGESRDISLRLRIRKDKTGCHRALLATMDMTGLKRAEQDLLETRGRLEEAQKVAKLGYYVLDIKKGIWSNCPQLDHIFGIDENYRRDIAGWLDIVHCDYRERMDKYFHDEVLGRRHEFDREYKIVNIRTGEERWVHGLGTLKFDALGRPLEMFGTIQDITARKRLEEETGRDIETSRNLLRLSEAIFSISDINELMRSVVNITREIINVDVVMSYLWDSDRKAFRPSAVAGLNGPMKTLFKSKPLSPGNELVREVMDTSRVMASAGKCGHGASAFYNKGICDWFDGAGSIALLPLVGKREYRGIMICICQREPRCRDYCFSVKKKELMQTVANQVSVALEDALHHKESINRAMELARKVETIETISNISKAILSTLDVGSIMELTARMVSRLVPCDWLRIIEVDNVGKEFSFTDGFEEGGALHSVVIPFDSTSLTTVLRTKRPEYISNLTKVASPRRIERVLVKEGYLSVLRIPIIAKGEVCGVLGLMARRVSAFGPSDLATLEDISSHVGVALDNARLVRDLEELSLGTLGALARSIDAKSPWTHGHSERVTYIALCIGKEIGLGKMELADLRVAGLLHDIGKIGTYEAILDKESELTENEMAEIRKHPGKGVEILSPIKQLRHLLPAIRGHHESFDGGGYPDGLEGEEIPLYARILAVADTVDAMSADRPYRKGQPREKIMEELKKYSGLQFDGSIVDAYLRSIA